MNIEEITKTKGHLIDRLLEEAFDGDIPNLHDAMKYHMETGGKRIRPILAIVTFETLGGDAKKILPFAAACEVLHNWILVHDDIEDGDSMRRGRPAVWVKYGLAHGVNVGDLMAQKVFGLILKSREQGLGDETVMRLLGATVTATVKTAEGQAMDINLRNNEKPTEEEYMKMVSGKTAHYLTLPMVGATIAAGREDMTSKIIEFGKFIGPAFQITDDMLDLTQGKGRGEIGSDIREGKRSILVIHCLAKCAKEERKELLAILEKGREETTSDDVQFVKALFEKYHSIEYARKKAEELAERAKAIADAMPKVSEILNFFADYLVKRER